MPGPLGSLGGTRRPTLAKDVQAALQSGFPIEVGNDSDSISQRIYVKRTDDGGKVLPK